MIVLSMTVTVDVILSLDVKGSGERRGNKSHYFQEYF